MQDAAMLWTGGKDSLLALYEAGQNGYRVCCLVTFAPPKPNFLAHPLTFIKMQAEALKLPHYIFSIHEPFGSNYEASLVQLRNETGVNTVITGDIAEVGGSPNWMRERCRPIGMNVHTPLWGCDRSALLAQLMDKQFKVLFSCIKTRWLAESWIGRELNDAAVADLRIVRERTGLDLCGEEGEYHTLVTDAPQFERAIDVRSYSVRATDSLAYMDIHELEFVAK